MTGPSGEPGPRPRRRWRRVVAVAAVIVVVAGTAGVLRYGLRTGAPAAASMPPGPTAALVRTTLVATVTVDGTLSHGPARTLVNQLSGTVTSVAAEGRTVRRGDRLYALDTDPVVLLYGPVPAYRTLEPGTRGADVAQLERNLRALRYTGFTVDDRYTAGTARAVRRWQRSLGLERTGVVEAGRVVFLPGAIRVAQVTAQPAQQIGPNAGVLSYTGTARVVTADLDVDQIAMARTGARVTVTLPTSGTVAGTISQVGAVLTAPPAGATGPGDDGSGAAAAPTASITCTVADQRALGRLDTAPVRVALTSERRAGVLAAPVTALLALREGGYGLRLVQAGAQPIVAVRTGLFAGGLVEVSGAGLAPGVVVETAPS
jgi:peptidoglycan hydrolase-like protein with peptidoglycan-binding domain